MICRHTIDSFVNTYNDSRLSYIHNHTETVLNLIKHPLHLLRYTFFHNPNTAPFTVEWSTIGSGYDCTAL